MADEVVCPECEERIEVRERDRIRGLKCPSCETQVIAPNPTRKPKYDRDDEPPDPGKIRPGSRTRNRASDDDRAPRPAPRAGPFVGCVLLIVLGIGSAFGYYWVRDRREAQANRDAGIAVKPGSGVPGVTAPFTVDPLLEQPDRPVYLADMQEFGVQMGPWKFAKGEMGNTERTPIKVRDQLAPKGLSVVPWDRQTTRVAYALGGKANTLTGAVGFNDGNYGSFDSMVFTVVGDGRELWRSGVLKRPTDPEAFRLDVSGVKVLELRATAQGSHWGMHAVWVDPVIEK